MNTVRQSRSPWVRVAPSRLPPALDLVLQHITEKLVLPSIGISEGHRVDVYRCRFSTNPVYRIRLVGTSTSRTIVAKWCMADATNDESQAELAHFTAFNMKCATPEIACPRVLGLIPGLQVILTEYEALPSFLDQLSPLNRHNGLWEVGPSEPGDG